VISWIVLSRAEEMTKPGIRSDFVMIAKKVSELRSLADRMFALRGKEKRPHRCGRFPDK
jgi:hypothetical protein